MAIALDITHVNKHYRMGLTMVRALDGVSLSVQPGEFIGLLGASGSGKSTLLNLIAGLDHATEGTLKVFDQDLSAMSREELSVHRRTNVGIIFQSFNLVSTMNAMENVALAMMFAGVPRAVRETRATALLESVGLGGRGLHRPRELSGGEQQRVAIARALINQPKLILADEPTGNLDEANEKIVMEIFRELHSAGHTILMVTHYTLIAREADRRIELAHGRLEQISALSSEDQDRFDHLLEQIWVCGEEGTPASVERIRTPGSVNPIKTLGRIVDLHLAEV